MESINTQGFSFDLPKGSSSIIKVIGVGGGGNNALRHMYEKGIHGVDFVICNTDAQTLDNNPISNKIQLGVTITEGLGAGADPEVGEKAALESIDEIKSTLGSNTKMVFITAGMGGGTGTGAAPVIAKIAKEMGILTIAIVTIPFSFEGKRRLEQAEAGLERLRNNVDSLIVINNDKLRQQFGNLGFKSGFAKADEVLANAAKGMAEVITGYFDVNIDFRDAKSVLQNSGTALISTGIATGENKAEEAVKKALDSPLLNDNKITGAKNVLLLIRSGETEATMDEIGLINDYIQREAGNTAEIIFGVGSDEELGDGISVLVIATGFAAEDQKYAGPTEKIKYTLDDTPSSPFQNSVKQNPFRTSTSQETPQNRVKEEKNLFLLDDNYDAPSPEFPTNSAISTLEKNETLIEEKIEELTFFVDKKEKPAFEENIFAEETKEELELFSFDDFETESLEVQSFSFEVEGRKPEIKKEIVEEKEIPAFKTKEPVEEKPIEFTFSIKNDEAEIEPVKNSNIEVDKPTEITEKQIRKEVISEAPLETEEEFKFVEKNSSSDRIHERRNKLKEFNSRYQILENENEFETIPAFKRKNINLGFTNASEQNISNFLSENNGRMELRENKFLNKDVD